MKGTGWLSNYKLDKDKYSVTFTSIILKIPGNYTRHDAEINSIAMWKEKKKKISNS